ncbi:TetR/AcrR family transcriptional regulator [Chelatococcus reniformis]|nr:TetR/AcrR family transcriptional regulator [Chelatococcus reniformis]
MSMPKSGTVSEKPVPPSRSVDPARRIENGSKSGGTPPGAPAARTRKRRRTQAERSEATQKKLLDAAVRLLRQSGFGGLRTSKVAELAGVSEGAQLHHFPTKRDLFVAALNHLNQNFAAHSRQLAKQAEASRDPIASIIDDAHHFFFSDFFFVELAVAMGDADIRDVRREAYEASRTSRFAVEAAWLDALVAHGIQPDIAGDVLTLTISIVRGFAVRSFLDNDQERFSQLYRVWREIVGSYLARHGATEIGRRDDMQAGVPHRARSARSR